MSATKISDSASLPTRSSDPLTVSLSTTWATLATPFISAAGNVPCLNLCPDYLMTGEPCYDAYVSTYPDAVSSYYSATDEAAASSAVTVINDLDYTLLSCMCKKTELSPWLTAATGVCDHGTYTSCANPASTDLIYLTEVHDGFSSMCGSLGIKAVDATTTAESSAATESADKTTGAAGTTGTGASQTTAAGNDSGAGKGVVSLTGALLAGFVGLAVVL